MLQPAGAAFLDEYGDFSYHGYGRGTGLFCAVLDSNVDAVRAALESGISVNSSSGFLPSKLLTRAVEMVLRKPGEGPLTIIEMLLQHGADPNVRDHGETLFHLLINTFLRCSQGPEVTADVICCMKLLLRSPNSDSWALFMARDRQPYRNAANELAIGRTATDIAIGETGLSSDQPLRRWMKTMSMWARVFYLAKVVGKAGIILRSFYSDDITLRPGHQGALAISEHFAELSEKMDAPLASISIPEAGPSSSTSLRAGMADAKRKSATKKEGEAPRKSARLPQMLKK